MLVVLLLVGAFFGWRAWKSYKKKKQEKPFKRFSSDRLTKYSHHRGSIRLPDEEDSPFGSVVSTDKKWQGTQDRTAPVSSTREGIQHVIGEDVDEDEEEDSFQRDGQEGFALQALTPREQLLGKTTKLGSSSDLDMVSGNDTRKLEYPSSPRSITAKFQPSRPPLVIATPPLTPPSPILRKSPSSPRSLAGAPESPGLPRRRPAIGEGDSYFVGNDRNTYTGSERSLDDRFMAVMTGGVGTRDSIAYADESSEVEPMASRRKKRQSLGKLSLRTNSEPGTSQGDPFSPSESEFQDQGSWSTSFSPEYPRSATNEALLS